ANALLFPSSSSIALPCLFTAFVIFTEGGGVVGPSKPFRSCLRLALLYRCSSLKDVGRDKRVDLRRAGLSSIGLAIALLFTPGEFSFALPIFLFFERLFLGGTSPFSISTVSAVFTSELSLPGCRFAMI